MTTLDLISSLIVDLDSLSVSGIKNALKIAGMFQKLEKLLQDEKKRAEEQEKADLERKKEERRKQLEEAAARGETIIGGETIRINADGSQEVIIP